MSAATFECEDGTINTANPVADVEAIVSFTQKMADLSLRNC